MKTANFIHPLDREMADKVLNAGVIKGFLNTIFDQQLDEINLYIHSASEQLLPEDHPAVTALQEGCRLFGLETVPPVYVTRTYRYDVVCTGYDHPVIQIPHQLLEDPDPAILRGRMMAAAASVKAGHHKLTFLIWILQNFGSVIPIPFATTVMRGLLYEWYRAQFYTLDRAFYIATGDAALSLKNVLYGEVSPELLNNFRFGTDDTYAEQVERFYQADSVVDGIAGISAFFQCESWLPARYRQLQKYCKEGS